jgi:NO-binding membrane sensor protein with MHYT domain
MAIPLIAPLAGALIGGLIQAAGSLVGRILIALGIGFVTYSGMNASLDVFRDYFSGALGDMGSVAAGVAGTLKLDVAFAIIVSAVTARLAINGLTSDTVKRMVFK